jgi:hypothetical protein
MAKTESNVRDYSNGAPLADTVVMVVRTGRYGTVGKGGKVRIARDELTRKPTADTLCTEAEYRKHLAAIEKARAEMFAGEIDHEGDRIAVQLDAAALAVAERRERDRIRAERDKAAGRVAS